MKEFILIDTQALVTVVEANSMHEAICIAREQGFKVMYVRECK